MAAHFESIRRLRFDSWEYIVVDNGSSDHTQAVIAAFAPTFPGQLVVVREPRRGSGRARNAGARIAQGEIVAFTDDDCYPAPDFLAAVSTCFAENPNLAYLGGRITQHDPTDYPMTYITSETPKVIEPYSFFVSGTVGGGNMAIRRDVLMQFGRFDVRRGAGTRYSGDDLEMASRLTAAGLLGAFDPRPVVAHHHRRKTRAEVEKRMAEYHKGRGVQCFLGLLDPRVRRTYARNWYWALRGMPRRVAAREVLGAMEYFLRYFGRLNSRRWHV